MRLIFTNLGLQLGCQIQLHETLLPTCTQHVSMLPTHALSAGHAWARPGSAFGGGARGPYLRAARAAAAVRASRPARATCSKRVRAVPARPLGSGTCAALPGGGCSGCAWGCTENSPVSRPRPAYRFLRKPFGSDTLSWRLVCEACPGALERGE